MRDNQNLFSIDPACLIYPIENAAKELIEVYNVFVSKVEELGLPSALDAKPLLDVRSSLLFVKWLPLLPYCFVTRKGKEVCAALPIKPGPQTGAILSRVVEWQLSHPDEGKAECETFLRGELDAGRLFPSIGDDGKRGANRRGKATKKAKD